MSKYLGVLICKSELLVEGMGCVSETYTYKIEEI